MEPTLILVVVVAVIAAGSVGRVLSQLGLASDLMASLFVPPDRALGWPHGVQEQDTPWTWRLPSVPSASPTDPGAPTAPVPTQRIAPLVGRGWPIAARRAVRSAADRSDSPQVGVYPPEHVNPATDSRPRELGHVSSRIRVVRARRRISRTRCRKTSPGTVSSRWPNSRAHREFVTPERTADAANSRPTGIRSGAGDAVSPRSARREVVLAAALAAAVVLGERSACGAGSTAASPRPARRPR